MSLILAIESDHRQAQQVARIARRVGAEVILADSFERALPAIGNRVPDLILVPALLSPQDDASLKFVLRMLEGAKHVQVVTTPLFAASSTAPMSRAMLPRFLRGRDTQAAGGCDPDEFARHVASYLQAAAIEKRSLPPPAPTEPPPAPVSTGRCDPKGRGIEAMIARLHEEAERA